jgi:HSP20 family protein
MFGLTRSNPFDDIFNFQREMDRVFSQFWNDLPTRTASAAASFQVNTTDDGWQVNVPLAGIDPQHINLEAAGNTLTIRAEVPSSDGRGTETRYQQTLTVPQFLDVEKLSATYQHGMLQLALPLKESVKPRRIQIATQAQGAEPKQIAATAGVGAGR